MITFERLLAPAMPVLAEIEQKRSPHFNETHTWMVFVRVLVYHFTMGFSSMRELVTGLRNADPLIDVPALPRSTISQMFKRFDPQLLRTAFLCLLETLALPENPELALLGTIHLVDGSQFPTIHEVFWDQQQEGTRHVKLHLLFNVNRMVAADFAITPAQSNERATFLPLVRAGVTYVLDRGYMEFQLIKDVIAAQASVVLRTYSNTVVETVEELPVRLPPHLLTVWSSVRDRLVQSTHPDMTGCVIRLVECTVGTTTYRLFTNRRDLTIFQVILLYAYRWQIELIFRALKWTINGVHVITEDVRGMNSFFAGLLLTAVLHLHLKRDCLAQEGYLPPEQNDVPDSAPKSVPTSDDGTRPTGYRATESVQTSDDSSRPTVHLAVASFLAHINGGLARFWKIPKHWLKTLAAWLHRPFTPELVSSP